jgi:hypothetical protein
MKEKYGANDVAKFKYHIQTRVRGACMRKKSSSTTHHAVAALIAMMTTVIGSAPTQRQA